MMIETLSVKFLAKTVSKKTKTFDYKNLASIAKVSLGEIIDRKNK